MHESNDCGFGRTFSARPRPWAASVPDELSRVGLALNPAQDRPGPRPEPTELTYQHDAEPAPAGVTVLPRLEPLPSIHAGTPPWMRVDIKGLRLIHESVRAYLVTREGGNSGRVWLPKSQAIIPKLCRDRTFYDQKRDEPLTFEVSAGLYQRVYRQL